MKIFIFSLLFISSISENSAESVSPPREDHITKETYLKYAEGQVLINNDKLVVVEQFQGCRLANPEDERIVEKIRNQHPTSPRDYIIPPVDFELNDILTRKGEHIGIYINSEFFDEALLEKGHRKTTWPEDFDVVLRKNKPFARFLYKIFYHWNGEE